MSQPARPSGRRRRPLTQAAVVRAAASLAEGGVERITMAAVADRLGVTPMALYQHVQDKDHLLGLLMNSLLERVEVPARAVGSWEKRLRTFHLDVTAAMTRYPGMVETPKTPPSEIPRLLDGYLQILLDAGFDPATAGRAYTGLYYLAMGVSHP